MNRLELARKFAQERKSARLASQIATRKLIKQGDLTDKEMLGLVGIYPEWQEDMLYKVGDLVAYHGKLYEVIQVHTSQADWLPNEVPALYKPTVPENVIPEWVQPTGSHDAYNIGDKVTYQGQVYESLINGNVWSPVAHPAGWKKI